LVERIWKSFSLEPRCLCSLNFLSILSLPQTESSSWSGYVCAGAGDAHPSHVSLWDVKGLDCKSKAFSSLLLETLF
jgi:hypothetical protein